MNDTYKNLLAVLEKDERLVIDGKLAKNKIVELALNTDEKLIELIKDDPNLFKVFFKKIGDITVFDQHKFQSFVSNKQFLPDSFTEFKNKVGLMADKNYISESREVVLAFPYKDCVLEGGQTKEDAKRDEVFWNETLASDEIDKLLQKKVLTNFVRFEKGESVPISQITINDSLLIKGNNLLSLYSLKEKYQGKIKLIYLDPPYNPDSKSNTFIYNNSFNESTWLTFMKNRLEVAKKLLTSDGSMIVAIDENEQAQIYLLLKEIFTEHELHCITIVHNPRGIQGTNFSYTHEYAIFVIPKGSKTIGNRKIEESEIDWRNLRDNGGESLRTDARNCFYPIIVEGGNVVGFGDVADIDYHPEKSTITKGNQYYVYPIDKEGIERKWRYARQSVDEIKHLLRAKQSKNKIEIELGKNFGTYRTVWIDSRYDANEYGTKLVKSLVPNCRFEFPKSIYNVYDCLYAVVANDKDAIVLDFFGGSGTTAHAVLMLNKEDGGSRKFIICEQMDYVEDVTRERIRKVTELDKQGNFVYAELMNANGSYISKIQGSSNTKELLMIWEEMKKLAFLSYKVKPSEFDKNIKDFSQLGLEDQKKLLISVLDKNLIYVPYSEIDDEIYAVSNEDKKLNHSFYKGDK